MTLEQVVDELREYSKPIKIMEVCGTHTTSIVKNGIPDLLSPSIRLVSGPGCPVCVTSAAYVDRLVDRAFRPGETVLSFGDLFRVRGSRYSLAQAKADGGSVQLIYSPLEAVALAREHPGHTFVVAAVGFETTTPIYAVLLEELVRSGLGNVRLLTSLKTMPAALAMLCRQEEIDAFLCPGHVAAVIGTGAFEDLCRRYRRPFVVAGFEPEHILTALHRILYQREHGLAQVENLYPSVVSAGGQTKAQALVDRYFQPANAFWRGIGQIEGSGMVLREPYRQYDLGSGEIGGDIIEGGCRCGDVLLGRIHPHECPLFGRTCTPANPVGACMLSSEGACGIWYGNGHKGGNPQ